MSDHQNLEPDPRSGFSASRLRAATCPDCAVVKWWNGDEQIESWEGLAMGLGHAVIVDRMTAVAAPGPEVAVVRVPTGFRVGWLPQRRWVEAAPDVFIARSGRFLLLSSPTLELPTVFSRPRNLVSMGPTLAPVG